MVQELRTTCNRDCPDSCGIITTVDNGRIIKHRGDPDHGITRGFLCYRGNHYLDRFYSKERILFPQRRAGKGWKRISWDDALDLAAEKLSFYRDKFNPLSILVVNYSGIRGSVARLLGRLFWSQFGGATFTQGGLSVEASHAAQHLDFGGNCTHAPEDLAKSRGFVIWGKNIAVTRPHAWQFVAAARKKGASLHVIDPVRCSTARRADVYYQIRPGSDALLALGIGRLLLKRGVEDRAFVGHHSHGFDEYQKLVFSRSLEEVAAATDLSRAQIEQLAAVYAKVKPLATMIGLGPSYWRVGGATVRCIDALAALSGNVGIPGGGAHTDTEEEVGFDYSMLEKAPQNKNRRILLPQLGREILSKTDPPIKMVWIGGANPAATAPDTGSVCRGLAAIDFLVVVDMFMTATAEYADLFLPCTTYLEMNDLISAYGHHWIGLTKAVVAPLGEARSDSEILQGLAKRLGFGAALKGRPQRWTRRLLKPLEAHGLSGDELAQRSLRHPLQAEVPFSDRRFLTSSGKYEFIREFTSIAAPTADDKLYLVATKTLKMLNSQVNRKDLVDEPEVKTHPDTVAKLGLISGDKAKVESAVGSVTACLKADETVRRDVLLFNPAAWQGDLQGVNQLREAVLADMGNAAAMHETRVSVRPWPPS
jgi:anaerobic selenocysteine-containing dehydrogenase